ncbi:MAG: hypothetical protein IJL51_01145 [Oscillospiraceae bacterium]|nr:hypothetical protein [Oscillospiraceae bacterium]
MKRQTANLMFRLICLLFSAVLAVATLLTGIDLTAESDRITARRAELQALQEENEGLRAEAACAVSLEELEDYALHVLGMQPCESRQIQIIDIGG